MININVYEKTKEKKIEIKTNEIDKKLIYN